MQRQNIRVGLAGWSNPPSERQARLSEVSHLAHYAGFFSCVEINSTFYRSHRGKTYARWRDETPDDFLFSVKLPRAITHESALRRTADDVARFYEEISHLQPKLGVILVQLSPSLEFSASTVRAFFKSLPDGFGATVACEPRHNSWFTPAATATLASLDVSRVAADPARCADAAVPSIAQELAYFRWHGSPQIYRSKYSDERLATFVLQSKNAAAVARWCIFDNTANHAAWGDALRFRALLTASEK